MRALGVVVSTPTLDDDLCLGEAVEDFAVEQFVTELRVEAFAVAVLPGAARLDVGGSRSDGGDPFSHSLGDELRAVACCRFRGHEDKIVTKELESGYDETEVQP